jgi:ABC-type branched-subunit amino acid transport system permease subunit/ABC-type branched-subunit amino acid transport system ATPase component
MLPASEVNTAQQATPRKSAMKMPMSGHHYRRYLLFALLIALSLALGFGLGASNLFIASTVAVYAIAAMGQEILVGRAGQISIGGAAFMALGAYIVTQTEGTGWSTFPVPLILAGLGGALVGLIVGLPALRLKGLYLLLITLALQYLVQFGGYELAHGHPSGFSAPSIHLGGLTAVQPRAIFFTIAAVAIVIALVLSNLYRQVPGQIWSALREDEIGAATMGISGVQWKLTAFVISSAVTAIGGGLLAYLIGTATYETFSLTLGINLIVMVFVGGAGSIIGACLGAAVVTLIPTLLMYAAGSLPAGGWLISWYTPNSAFVNTAIFGLALVVVLLYAPGGIAGGLGRVGVWLSAVSTRSRHSDTGETSGRLAVTPEPDEQEPLRATTAEPQPHTEAGASRVDALSDTVPFLAVRDLLVRYPNGALGADHVSLDLAEGAVGALVGRNGAGKTSTIRAIAGFSRTERARVKGTILIGDADLSDHPPERRVERGVVLVAERDKVFPHLSVVEHLLAVGLKRSAAERMVDSYPALAPRADVPAGLLSGGQRQLLALAVAMSRRPRLLLVDEVSQGLAPIAIQAFMDQLAEIRQDSGITILLSDQSAAIVSDAATNIFPLEHGTNASIEAVEQWGSPDEIEPS